MRRYVNLGSRELQEVRCNLCGKEMKLEQGYLKEGCFAGEQVFGYFSKKDGFRHSFDLCENCYDKFVETFAIPVDISEETELM